jgi:hypothetical protein
MNPTRCFALCLAVAVCLLAGCVKQVTKGEKYPLMYTETPKSLLVLPPMNESTSAEAKPYYATTIQEILSYWGYYVYPYEVTTDILKMEGIYDAELLKDVPLAKFRQYFGADAVLFTTIKKWDVAYIVIASNLTVSIDAELKSTHSDQLLWDYNGTVVVDLSGGNTGGGGEHGNGRLRPVRPPGERAGLLLAPLRAVSPAVPHRPEHADRRPQGRTLTGRPC